MGVVQKKHGAEGPLSKDRGACQQDSHMWDSMGHEKSGIELSVRSDRLSEVFGYTCFERDYEIVQYLEFCRLAWIQTFWCTVDILIPKSSVEDFHLAQQHSRFHV